MPHILVAWLLFVQLLPEHSSSEEPAAVDVQRGGARSPDLGPSGPFGTCLAPGLALGAAEGGRSGASALPPEISSASRGSMGDFATGNRPTIA